MQKNSQDVRPHAVYLRQENKFFHYEDLNNKTNGNLKMAATLGLVFFVMGIPLKTTATLARKSQHTE